MAVAAAIRAEHAKAQGKKPAAAAPAKKRAAAEKPAVAAPAAIKKKSRVRPLIKPAAKASAKPAPKPKAAAPPEYQGTDEYHVEKLLGKRGKGNAVERGLGRTAALCHRSSASCQTPSHNRCLCF